MRRLLLILMLYGCTTVPPARPPAPPAPSAQQFAMNGRISINQQGTRQSAGLRWTHTTQSDEILLLAPLGQTVARVYSDQQHASLDNGNQHYQAENVETLMQQLLGWYLPMAGLHSWVLGREDNAAPALIERDLHGQLSLLRQNGWEIHYLRYADTQPDSLPTRMQLKHNGMELQLLIDEWDTP